MKRGWTSKTAVFTAPDGFEFMLDDEGKPVVREPKEGELYLFGGLAITATHNHQNYAYPILIPAKPLTVEIPRELADGYVEKYADYHGCDYLEHRIASIIDNALKEQPND